MMASFSESCILNTHRMCAIAPAIYTSFSLIHSLKWLSKNYNSLLYCSFFFVVDCTEVYIFNIICVFFVSSHLAKYPTHSYAKPIQVCWWFSRFDVSICEIMVKPFVPCPSCWIYTSFSKTLSKISFFISWWFSRFDVSICEWGGHLCHAQDYISQVL